MRKFKIQDSKSQIRRLVVGAALICFFVLNSFSLVFMRPPYKTIRDSVFVIDDYITIPSITFNYAPRTGIWQDSIHHGMDSLKLVAEFLERNPNLSIEIGNHTDVDYSEYSTHVSYGRAASCVDSLVRMGIQRDRLVAKGYGESEPFILDRDITLPSGKILGKGAVLTDKFINVQSADVRDADYEFMRRLNRQTFLKVLRTDFTPTSGN